MESQTRREWRTRIVALLDYERTHGCRRTDIEEWLNDWMQTSALELAEYRDEQPSAPNLRLAVVELRQSRTCLACHGKAKNPDGTECRCCLGSGVTSGEPWVVKMEDK